MKEIKNNKDELIILLRGLNRLIRFNMSWDFKRKDWQKSIEWRMDIETLEQLSFFAMNVLSNLIQRFI